MSTLTRTTPMTKLTSLVAAALVATAGTLTGPVANTASGALPPAQTAMADAVGAFSDPGTTATATAPAKEPAVTLRPGGSAGAWVPVKPAQVLGGSSGQSLAAGAATTLRLSRPAAIPAVATGWFVHVSIIGSAKAGTLTVGSSSTPVVTFPKGSSTTSSLLKVEADSTLVVKSTRSIRLVMTVVGYQKGSFDSVPGAGGSHVITPTAVANAAKQLGGDLPSINGSARLSVAGLGEVPTAGLRAVWLSVQTKASGSGWLAFRRYGGGGSNSSMAQTRTAWTTSLVLAAVDSTGRICYKVRNSTLKSLRITVLGWVAEAGPDADTSVIAKGLTLSVGKKVTPSYRTTTKGQKIYRIKLAKHLPTAAGRILFRVSMTAGPSGGWLRTGLKQKTVHKAKGTPIPARSVVNALISQNYTGGGYIYLAVPGRATISQVTYVGTVLKATSTAVDTVAPTVTLTNPGTVNLAKTPQVRLTGGGADAHSGLKWVRLFDGATLLGNAQIDTTKRPPVWSLTTSLTPGQHSLQAVAMDFAGHQTQSAATSVTVAAPPGVAVVWHPAAVALASSICANLRTVTADSVTFDRLVTVAVGARLACPASTKAPGGLLRQVTWLKVTKGLTKIGTVPAGLTDFILQGELVAKAVPLSAPVAGQPIKWSLPVATDPPANQLPTIIDGSLTVAATVAANATITANWNNGPLAKSTLTDLDLTVGTGLTASVKATANSHHDGSLSNDSSVGAAVNLSATSLNLGGLPLTITGQVAPAFQAALKADPGERASSAVKLDLTSTATWANGRWQGDQTASGVVHEAAVTGQAEITGRWQANLRLTVAGLPGLDHDMTATTVTTAAATAVQGPTAAVVTATTSGGQLKLPANLFGLNLAGVSLALPDWSATVAPAGP